MYKIKSNIYIRHIFDGVKLIIVAISFFLLSSVAALAHEGEENITVISEADWMGPLVAVLIIIAAIVIARIIKKSRKN